MKKEKLKFYLLDLTYKIADDKAQIWLFGKTLEGMRIAVVDDSFEPYFYVLLKNNDEIDSFCQKIVKIRQEYEKREAAVVKAEPVEKKFLGKPRKAVKVFVRHPSDVPVIRDIIKEWDIISAIHEFDIPFIRRYLLDKGFTPLTLLEAEAEPLAIQSRVPVYRALKIAQFNSDSISSPRILAFDIETYNPKGKRFLPEEFPVIMIAFYGMDGNKPFKKVLTWKRFKTELEYIEFVDGEIELLQRFKEVFAEFKPDIIAGYYSDGFDFPYILTRAKRYKIDMDISLDYSNIKFQKTISKNIQINGIIHFDVFKFIAKIMGRSMETDSFSLDAVSKELLGEQKDEADLDMLSVAWDWKPELLEAYCKYNLQDAALTFRLAEKVWPNLEEMVKIIGLPAYEVNRMGFSQLVEAYIEKQIQVYNEIFPNKPGYQESGERKRETYQGAFVYEPTPGLYDNIVVFDFRSLYPTIIASLNICLSTLKCNCCKMNAKRVPIDGYDYWFCKNKKGFLPAIIEDLINRRSRIKELLKDKKDPMLSARSESLKLLANSFYGYLGFFGARWYCIECARSITAYGRYYITKVIEEAKNENFQVLYTDTDSIFLALNNKTQKEAIDFVEHVNQALPGIMELDFQGFYPAGIFVSAKEKAYGAKKKYALLDSKGKLKITGFETVRSNWSLIAKEAQEGVLEIVLKEKDLAKALKFVKQIIQDLKSKAVAKEKVVINTQITKGLSDYAAVGPHVAIAKKMQEQGEDIGPGSRIRYIITEGAGKTIRDKARLPEEVTNNYDAEYYINNQVIPAVKQILEVLGYKEEDLTKGQQSKLGSFF